MTPVTVSPGRYENPRECSQLDRAQVLTPDDTGLQTEMHCHTMVTLSASIGMLVGLVGTAECSKLPTVQFDQSLV
jgi:hypothetical protein